MGGKLFSIVHFFGMRH